MTSRIVVGLALAVGLAGCTSIVQQNQGAALAAAERRAAFELDCPQVSTTVISQKTIQGIRWEAAEYTIGARGCGRQAVYLTYCRDPSDCNALAQTGRVQEIP